MFVIGVIGSMGEENVSDGTTRLNMGFGKVKMPMDAAAYEGSDYRSAVSEFEELGFTDIQVTETEDLGIDEEEGFETVKEILIDGEPFEKNDRFSKDSSIEVIYHGLKDEAKVPLEEVKAEVTSKVLEYSTKETDPVKLIHISDDYTDLSIEQELDLTTVGEQKLTGILQKGKKRKEQTFEFTVVDTKKPEINIETSEITIDQGSAFDPYSNITAVTDSVDGELVRIDSIPDTKIENAGKERYFDTGWYTITGNLDVNVPSKYFLEVTASDIHGNMTKKEFSVMVNEVRQPEPEPEQTAAVPVPEPAPAPAAPVFDYIGNMNTGKFHYPSCSSVSRMKDTNKAYYTCTRDEMLAMGYVPCNKCNP